jgi:hypothetical protein
LRLIFNNIILHFFATLILLVAFKSIVQGQNNVLNQSFKDQKSNLSGAKNQLKKESKKQKQIIGNQLNLIADKLPQTTKILNGKSVPVQQVNVSGNSFLDQGSIGRPQWVSGNQLVFSSVIKGIPFKAQAQYNHMPTWGDVRNLSNGLRWSYSFDYEKMMGEYKSQLKNQINELDPDTFLDSSIQHYKNNVESQLKQRRQDMLSKMASVQKELDIVQLLNADSLNPSRMLVLMESNSFQRKITDKYKGDSLETELMNNRIDSLKELVKKTAEWQEKLEEIISYGTEVKQQVLELVDGANIARGDLNALMGNSFVQNLLTKISSLQMGSNILSSGLSGMSNGGMALPMNGLGMNFNSGNSFGGVSFGSVPAELFSINQISNIDSSGNLSPMALTAKPKLWGFSYGKGDKQAEFIEFRMRGLSMNSGGRKTSVSLGLSAGTFIFKDILLNFSLEKNASTSGGNSGMGATARSISNQFTGNILEGLSYGFSLKGSHLNNRLTWKGGFEQITGSLFADAGLMSFMPQRRIYLRGNYSSESRKFSSTLQFDNRKSDDSYFQVGGASFFTMLFQARLKLNKEWMIFGSISPAQSKYQNGLADSILNQAVKGLNYSLGNIYQKRIDGSFYVMTNSLDYYTSEFRIQDENIQNIAALALPGSKSLGFSHQSEMTLLNGNTFSFGWVGMKDLSRNDPEKNSYTNLFNDKLDLSAASSFTVKNNFRLGMGMGYYYMKQFNETWYVKPEVNFLKKKFSFGLSARVNLKRMDKEQLLFGFANRYNIHYQISL